MPQDIDEVFFSILIDYGRFDEPVGISAPVTEEGTTRIAGIDLSAMVPTADEFGKGAVVDGQSFAATSPVSNTVLDTYVRDFTPADVSIELGGSHVLDALIKLSLLVDEQESRAHLDRWRELSTDVIQFFLVDPILEDLGLQPSNIKTQAKLSELGELGDDAVGYLVRVDYRGFDWDYYYLFFARGRIFAFLHVMGPADFLDLQDVVSVALKIDEMISTPLAEVYTNATIGYSTAYPTGWRVNAEEDGDVFITHPSGTAVAVLVQKVNGQTSEDSLNLFLGGLAYSITGWTETSRTEIDSPPGYVV